MINLYNRLVKILASKLFAWIVIGLAAFNGVWIAIVSRYPMAFDEAYHFNHIKLHASTWSPILYQQPAGSATYGAVTRDPSQLYHFLLSLPYRLFEVLGFNEVWTIISLRLISLFIFCLGLYYFRKLLLKTKASVAAVNSSLLFFILLPTVPTLSGQINYDNLQFLMVPVLILNLIIVVEQIKANKLKFTNLSCLAIVGLIGCLTKFSFLPFLLAAILVVCWQIIKAKRIVYREILSSWSHDKSSIKFGSIVLLIVSLGLFVWFYGVNTVVYHNPVVQCHQVLGPVRCQTFEPWQRNYQLASEVVMPTANPLKFSQDWIGGMFYRTMFVINGASGPERYVNHVPVPISLAVIVLTATGSFLFLRFGTKIIKKDIVLEVTLFCGFVYLLALVGRNYNDYLQLGRMVAINGRYLQPILPPLILLMIAGFQRAFKRMPKIKLTIFAVALVMFSLGGGITGFLYYSNINWRF